MAVCRNPFKNRLAFKMGQIVDKAASLCQSNELGSTRSISTERCTHPTVAIICWEISDYYFLHVTSGQIIDIFLVKCVSECDMLMLMWCACFFTCMSVAISSYRRVCAATYSDDDKCVYIDLQLLV